MTDCFYNIYYLLDHLHYNQINSILSYKKGSNPTPHFKVNPTRNIECNQSCMDTVTVKSRTTRKVLLLYFNLCLSVMLDSLPCSFTFISFHTNMYINFVGGCRSHDHMVIGYITTYAISAYHH
jgi:hypothetical protein